MEHMTGGDPVLTSVDPAESAGTYFADHIGQQRTTHA